VSIHGATRSSNPFGDRRFAYLFSVGAAVNWIRWAEIFAFSLITFELTGSPFIVVVVGLVRMVPLVFSAFIGLVAHRISARRVIGASVTTAALLHAGVAALAITDRLSVWHLVLVAFASGVTLAVDFTVRRPLLGSIVSRDLLGRAMSLDFTANTVARMVGPALAGALLDSFGRPAIFVLGVIVYGVAIASLVPVDLSDVEVPASGADWAALREGYRFARRSPSVMSVVVTTIGINLFVFPYRHFVPVIGTEVLGLSATLVGLLTAVEGAGMTVSSLAMALWVRPRHFVATLDAGMGLAAAGVITFGLSTSVIVSMIAVFAVGVGVAGFANMQPAVVVAETPSDLRSRVMGLIGTLIGTNPLGLLLLGSLATGLGAAPAVVVIGSIGLSEVVLRTRRARRRPT
jgi:MFS family permease